MNKRIEIDKHVGNRIRGRRLELGMTQQDLAQAIGLTYQQVHKYEKAMNRVAAGTLHHTARALGVEVSYFFEDLPDGPVRQTDGRRSRMAIELMRNFFAIPDPGQQESVAALCRSLAATAAHAPVLAAPKKPAAKKAKRKGKGK